MLLASLPSDILFNIFTLFDNLHDLHAAVSITRSLRQAFWDHHAGALQHVFRNQILKYRDDHIGKPYYPNVRCMPLNQPTHLHVLQCIRPIIERYEKSKPPDTLILRSTAWSAFISFNSPEWIFISLGDELISLCRSLNQHDLAFSYTVELWKYISTRQTSEHLSRSGGILSTDRYASAFARTLAGKYYHDLKRPEEAARTILQCYNMDMRDHDYKLFSYILKYTQDMVDPAEVFSFFRERAGKERKGLIENGVLKGDLHWTFCYALLLSELEKIQDAVGVFNDTYDVYTHNLNLDPVTLESLSRRLIKSLKNQKHLDEAFTIHRQMLSLLSRMHRTSTSKYMAWANQFISELYFAGRPDEALAVEEQCWSRLRERLAGGKDLGSVYTGRAAAWALYRSYEKRGKLKQARRTRAEYESLSRACMKPGSCVVWPGEHGGGYLVRTGNGQKADDRYLPFRVGSGGSTVQVQHRIC